MSGSTPVCPHLIDPLTCPACAQEQFDAHIAIQLAARDPETVEQWRREFEAWVETDPQPTTEVA